MPDEKQPRKRAKRSAALPVNEFAIRKAISKLVIALRELGVKEETAIELADGDHLICWQQIRWIRYRRSAKNIGITLPKAIRENWIAPTIPPAKAEPLPAPYHEPFKRPEHDKNAQADFELQMQRLGFGEKGTA